MRSQPIAHSILDLVVPSGWLIGRISRWTSTRHRDEPYLTCSLLLLDLTEVQLRAVACTDQPQRHRFGADVPEFGALPRRGYECRRSVVADIIAVPPRGDRRPGYALRNARYSRWTDRLQSSACRRSSIATCTAATMRISSGGTTCDRRVGRGAIRAAATGKASTTAPSSTAESSRRVSTSARPLECVSAGHPTSVRPRSTRILHRLVASPAPQQALLPCRHRP